MSDYKDRSFGPAYGVFIKEIAMLARSVFLVDKDGVIRYIEIVPEVAQEPNYDKALEAARQLIGSVGRAVLKSKSGKRFLSCLPDILASFAFSIR